MVDCGHDPECLEEACLDAQYGSWITEGAKEEDDLDFLANTCNVNPLNLAYGYFHHYYDPDISDPNGLQNNIVGSGYHGAFWQAQAYWNFAKVYYSVEPIDKHKAYWMLGRIAHLLADTSVPAHVHNDSHAFNYIDGKDSYEDHMAEFEKGMGMRSDLIIDF